VTRRMALAAGLAASLLLLGFQSANAQAPGTTSVTIRNPDPAKWAGSSNIFGRSTGEFVCRPLACSDAAKVTATISRSPTRSPDPQALAKLASQIPESVERANQVAAAKGRKLDRLSSGTTTLRGYPAIVQELRVIGEKGPAYLSKATMFVKSAVVSISSFSPSHELARRNRDLFIKAMEVSDTPLPRS
jgi:hypothetical protein